MNAKWKIIIAERGWVYVGRLTREEDQMVIRDCWNLRRWGTSTGLGQLAKDGPTPETVVDHYGVVRIHVLAVVGVVDCNQTAWDKWSRKSKP